MGKSPTKRTRVKKSAAVVTGHDDQFRAAAVEAADEKPKGATLRRMTPEEVAALSAGFAATAAPPPKPARKQSSPAVSSLAGHVMRQPIDQKLWNSIRNDEQAFYALMIERQTLAACVLANDETPGQA